MGNGPGCDPRGRFFVPDVQIRCLIGAHVLLVAGSFPTRGKSMIDRKTESEDLAQADMTVARAYKALEVAVELLESTLDAARAAKDGDTTEVVKDVRAVGVAFQTALQVEVKARDAGSQRYSRRGTGQLDLDTARAEIGRRLARLRAARDDGRLSEGVE